MACLPLLAPGCAGSTGFSRELADAALALARRGTADRETAGLREALEVATGRAVARTSRDGGFRANDLIRIRLPEPLETPARLLRVAGFGAQVDELETAMNRAAERAAAGATPLFVDAVRGLTFADARRIIGGGGTAATDYFRERTGDRLAARFRPEVQDAMRQVGLYHRYEVLLASYDRLPFTEKPNLDLSEYVTARTVDGLFRALGEEERRIRTDPVARTTELLREVFGNRTGPNVKREPASG